MSKISFLQYLRKPHYLLLIMSGLRPKCIFQTRSQAQIHPTLLQTADGKFLLGYHSCAYHMFRWLYLNGILTALCLLKGQTRAKGTKKADSARHYMCQATRDGTPAIEAFFFFHFSFFLLKQ